MAAADPTSTSIAREQRFGPEPDRDSGSADWRKRRGVATPGRRAMGRRCGGVRKQGMCHMARESLPLGTWG